MSTSMNEISKALRTYKPKVYIQENITIANFYYLHDELKDFNSNCLYVCKSSQLPDKIVSDSLINLLIILDKKLPTNILLWEKYNLILLDDNKCSIYTLLENLQDLINLDTVLNHFVKTLIEGISNNLTLNKLIEIAYEYLENPIIITNASNHICSYFTGNTNIDEPIWEEYIAKGFAPSSYLKSLYYDLNFRQSISIFNQPIVLDYFSTMNHRLLIASCIKEGFNIAHVSVLEVNKPFSKIDIEILNILNRILIPKIIIDKRFLIANNTPFDSLFYYLMNTLELDKNYIRSYLDNLNISLSSNLYLICIKDLSNFDSFEKIKYLYNYLTQIFSNHYVYIYSYRIYILYNGRENEYLKEDEENLLNKLLKENNLKAGISNCFYDLEELKIASQQAMQCIKIGDTIESYKYIFYYEKNIINNLIFSYITDNSINDLLDLRLKNFIVDNNEELINTLKIYCNNNGDMQQSSHDLHIHYNTLKYRLNKIKDLYSFDIFDVDTILKLKISFLALDFLKPTTDYL